MKKRILALVLCLLMVVPMVAVPASANATQDMLREAIEYLRVNKDEIQITNYTTPEELADEVMRVLSAVMTEDMGITATTMIDPVSRKNATATEEGFRTVRIILQKGSDTSDWHFTLTIPATPEDQDEIKWMEEDVAAVTAAWAEYFATANVTSSNIFEHHDGTLAAAKKAAKHCQKVEWAPMSFSVSTKKGYIHATLHMVLGGQTKDLELDVTIHSDGSTTMNKPVAASAKPEEPTTPVTPAIPTTGTAYPSTQVVDLDGKKVEFQMYALRDANGNPTNYVKVRDLALSLNDTQAKFAVTWSGVVNLVAGLNYTPNGTENKTPFSGERTYSLPANPTNVNGAASDLVAIYLVDDAGGGYTYYQLRDLASKLGFNASWSKEKGVFIETDKPYSGK